MRSLAPGAPRFRLAALRQARLDTLRVLIGFTAAPPPMLDLQGTSLCGLQAAHRQPRGELLLVLSAPLRRPLHALGPHRGSLEALGAQLEETVERGSAGLALPGADLASLEVLRASGWRGEPLRINGPGKGLCAVRRVHSGGCHHAWRWRGLRKRFSTSAEARETRDAAGTRGLGEGWSGAGCASAEELQDSERLRGEFDLTDGRGTQWAKSVCKVRLVNE